MLSREAGQSRVPAPPHMMMGMIVRWVIVRWVMASSLPEPPARESVAPSYHPAPSGAAFAAA
jgi:hypothetical protein